MRKIRVNLNQRSYDIHIDSGLLVSLGDSISKLIGQKKTFVITDSNVDKLYAHTITALLKENSVYIGKYVFQSGEEHKNLKTVETGYCAGVQAGLDRHSVIVSIGGGVCGDLAGFIAATYMRGIKFIQIPTTLLAMIDSSIGGKTGLDLNDGKNLIGAFWQPKGVFIDTKVLDTLPRGELLCGLAEVIKYGMIYDAKFFEYLENNIDALKQKQHYVYEYIIERCCSMKADIVSRDEKENSLRMILNFGHTFGHAIEVASYYSKYKHGEAIAIGMLMSCELGIILDTIDSTVKSRLQNLIRAISLPCKAENLDAKTIFDAMSRDKKNKDGKIQFVIPEKGIGKVKIISNVDDNLVIQAIVKHL